MKRERIVEIQKGGALLDRPRTQDDYFTYETPSSWIVTDDKKRDCETYLVNPKSLFEWYGTMVQNYPEWIIASQGLTDEKYKSDFPKNNQEICDDWIMTMHQNLNNKKAIHLVNPREEASQRSDFQRNFSVLDIQTLPRSRITFERDSVTPFCTARMC